MDVLGQQLNCCNQLMKLSTEQRDALKEHDVQGLFGLCEKITVLSQNLTRLEEERAEMHSAAASRLGLSGDTSLRDLLAALRGQKNSLADRLEQEAFELNSAYINLKYQNELNQLLLRQAVAYANTIVSVLRPDHKLTYGRAGGMYSQRLHSPFVNRTV